MGNFPTQESPNYLFNYWTDFTTNPPSLAVGQLGFHPDLGWMREPFNGQHSLMKIEWSSSDPIYIGTHRSPIAADGDTDWIISKLTWSSHQLTQMKTLVGSWTNRASLSW